MSADTTGNLGTILGIWGHPDDEAYLSAGLMVKALEAGHRAVCVTATKGEAGFAADDPRTVDERQAVRQSELAACLAVLGVTEHHWLGYGDGKCAEVPDEEPVALLADMIDEIRPDTVLTFGPDGATGHSDHVAACRWTTLAFERVAAPGSRLLYATKSHQWQQRFFAGIEPAAVMMVEGLRPESVDPAELAVWFSCDDGLLARKVAALRTQASQIEPFAQYTGIDTFSELVREEFFRDRRPSDQQTLDRMTILGR